MKNHNILVNALIVFVSVAFVGGFIVFGVLHADIKESTDCGLNEELVKGVCTLLPDEEEEKEEDEKPVVEPDLDIDEAELQKVNEFIASQTDFEYSHIKGKRELAITGFKLTTLPTTDGEDDTFEIGNTFTIDGEEYKTTIIEHSVFEDKLVVRDEFDEIISGVSKVTISKEIKIIEEYAFHSNAIEELVLEDGVEFIGDDAFQDNLLTTVDFSNTLKIIEDYAFEENVISEVILPNSLIEIGSQAFYNNGITKLTLGTGLEIIETGAFRRNKLTRLTIPNNVKVIEGAAFSINSIATLKLGSSLEDIQDGAFSRNKLTTLNIPASLKTVGINAFGSNSITEIIFEGNKIVGDFEGYKNDAIIKDSKGNELTWPKDEDTI